MLTQEIIDREADKRRLSATRMRASAGWQIDVNVVEGEQHLCALLDYFQRTHRRILRYHLDANGTARFWPACREPLA